MTITPPLWGVVLASAIAVACCFWVVIRQEAKEAREQLERDVLAGLPQRYRRVPTQEIESDDIPA